MSAYDLLVEPDYGQFYACRSGADWATDRVSSDGYERHLWSNGSLVYVGTERRFGTTGLRVEVLDARPSDEIDPAWQHVAEVSLDPGADLEIFSWGENEALATIPIDTGPVRCRVHWRGLVADRVDGLDDEGNSDEALLLQTWPAPVDEPEVVRWWAGWLLPAPTTTAPDGHRQIEGLDAVVEALARLEVVARPRHPYPPMPGGGAHSSVVTVLRDRADGSWWVDGYDVRRTLREVTEDDATRLAGLTPDS